MMTDDTRALYLVENWDECFPAVTGADVDLDHRRELMEMFREFRANPSLSKNSRQAATLWMGLVFLTDPVEFAGWREPIRDAMLEIPEPIQADHHDCWMRVLDTLLAYDSPASWPAATQVLASHPTTLRRAVRERVRGVMSHFDAIVREFDDSERSGDWNGAFAIWQDTGRWLAAYPGSAGEHRVKQWRSTTMFRWLETDGLGTKWDKLFHNQEILVNLTPEDLGGFHTGAGSGALREGLRLGGSGRLAVRKSHGFVRAGRGARCAGTRDGPPSVSQQRPPERSCPQDHSGTRSADDLHNLYQSQKQVAILCNLPSLQEIHRAIMA